MAKLTLYRKHRPEGFEHVIGQEHVISVLSEAVKNGAFSHAYLFAGKRGTGKTSTARILARSIGASERDVYEIDAASNRGINDIRDLKEAVETLPFESPYKVYIIDEAHMLTKEAFNALLKTLEEPPEHVIFVLATTELHKLPDTIISRCEVYKFREPTRNVLVDFLTEVASKEGYSLEGDAADRLALLAEGSFRDALSGLQKVLTYSGKGKKITLKKLEVMLGMSEKSLLLDVVQALSGEDAKGVLEALERAEKAGIHPAGFLDSLLEYVRYILLLRMSPARKEGIEEKVGSETTEALLALGKEKTITSKTLEVLLEAYSAPEHPSFPYLPLELALMKLFGQDTEVK